MKPKVLRGPVQHRDIDGNESTVWWIKCPGCGMAGMIDRDQYEGRVSVDCTSCPYHETHDMRGGGGE